MAFSIIWINGVCSSNVWMAALYCCRRRNQIYLGSEDFVARMHKKVRAGQDLSEIPRAQRRPVAKPLKYYTSRYRDPHVGMVAAYRSGDYSMKAIADQFGVHYSTVSRAVKTGEDEG